jgi:uncharacterized protein involved in type VI secretion and phage assembly
MSQFFGKYRGKVENNVDPEGRGRLQVSVAKVLGAGRNSWALPCVPFAGPGIGFFALPPRKANVWVEFEGGDPDYPIWCGGFWENRLEVPTTQPVEGVMVIKTDAGTLTMSTLPGVGGVTIEAASGMKITISSTGIEITNAQVPPAGPSASIALNGPKVSVNGGSLEVIS